MKLSLSRRLNAGFAIAILLVILVGVISLGTFQKQNNETELVKHSYQVKNQLEQIRTLMIDMETGRRGFRSTSDKRFLTPYTLALNQIEPAIVQLHVLI